MRAIILSLIIAFGTFSASAQKQSSKATKPIEIKNKIVETACGGCMFHMEGKGCNLAVKIDGKNYFVDGTNIDDQGDAHADDGLCNAVRKAEVSGKIVNDRFVASNFKLLPAEKKAP